MARWLVIGVVVVASGCGRIFFEAPRATGDAGGLDAPRAVDATTPADTDEVIDAGNDAPAVVDAATPPDANEDAYLPPCDESPCRLVAPQCGCAGGLACQRPFGDDVRRACIPPGDRAPGEICTLNADCTTGYACVAVPGGTVGLCEAYCGAAADCASGTFCRELVVISEDVGTCATRCDPVANTGCPGSFGCMVATGRDVPARGFVTWSFCTAGGPAIGAPCPEFSCDGGGVCVGGTCRRVCDVSMPACTTGSCRGFAPAAVIGGREIGYCE